MQFGGSNRTPVRRMARKKRSLGKISPAADDLATAELVENCCRGDARAADAIFGRYVGRLTALARGRLSRRLTARFDESDVVMSAYRSFFIGLREREFTVANGGDLWQLLVQIMLRKLYRQVARHEARKRSVRRDVRIDVFDQSEMPIPDREPRPEEAAALADELEFVLGQLQPLGRRVLELRLQGEEIAAIAAELRVNERTVRRWIDRARQIVAARSETAGDERTNDSGQPQPERSTPAARSQRKQRKSSAIPLPKSLPKIELEDYLLQTMIGAGASGKVYQALCRTDGKSYAVKFLRKAFVTQPDAVRRFLAEFALVAQLHHPHIMPVLGCGRTRSGAYFFAMELAGGDLQQRIAGRISPAQAVAWLRQAAEGIGYAHERGVIHCDLKPSNLLLSKQKQVLVSDFGLAGRVEDLAGQTRLAGTPAFMAPEQASSNWGDVSVRTDIYGLGATLYALLTGRPPFVGQRASDVLAQVVSAATPVSPRTLKRRIPQELSETCMRCLAKRPVERFATIGALLDALPPDGALS